MTDIFHRSVLVGLVNRCSSRGLLHLSPLSCFFLGHFLDFHSWANPGRDLFQPDQGPHGNCTFREEVDLLDVAWGLARLGALAERWSCQRHSFRYLIFSGRSCKCSDGLILNLLAFRKSTVWSMVDWSGTHGDNRGG